MALKINTNQSATAFHIVDGAFLFPYAIDASMAVSQHPLEWSDVPWTEERAAEARARINERNKAEGLAPLAEPSPLSPEDQAALDEHNRAVAEAAKRLADYRAKKAEEQKLADQAAADEALVGSAPPRPDPTARRPFGRKGEMTPAEKAAADKKAVDGKRAGDALAGNTRSET